MAQQLPGRPGKRRLNAEINVVPYIDVMLVLLIIFMVTAPLLTQGVEVELPKASAEAVQMDAEPVTLIVDKRGNYFLDVGSERSKPLEEEELVRRVRIVLETKPDTTVLLRADKAVDYGRVANGMALLQQAGAAKLGFVTDLPEPSKR